jgi:hypothetical protein
LRFSRLESLMKLKIAKHFFIFLKTFIKLFKAAQNGQLDILKFLCEMQADINSKNSDGATPLYIGD